MDMGPYIEAAGWFAIGAALYGIWLCLNSKDDTPQAPTDESGRVKAKNRKGK